MCSVWSARCVWLACSYELHSPRPTYDIHGSKPHSYQHDPGLASTVAGHYLAGTTHEIKWIDEGHVGVIGSGSQHDAGSHAKEKVLHFQVESQPIAVIAVCPELLDLGPHALLYPINQICTTDK